MDSLGRLDLPVAVRQAEVLTHHIEAPRLQRVVGRRSLGLVNNSALLRDGEVHTLPGVADEIVLHVGVSSNQGSVVLINTGQVLVVLPGRGCERVYEGVVDRLIQRRLIQRRLIQRVRACIR
eukprot:scaffold52721_cov59-Phaeocystis_antarctica.AAC.2